MASFCVQCGSPLSGAFCVQCGADARLTTNSAPDQPSTTRFQSAQTAPQSVSSAHTGSTTLQPAPPKTGMSPLVKLAVAAIVIIFVGGTVAAVGMFYVAHRVSQKFHQVSDGILNSNSDSSSAGSTSSGPNASSDNALGDVCRFLSKEDVSKAIGIEIVGTKSEDNACSYLARGNSADMTAKHMAAIAGTKGADARAQKMTEQIAGGLFKSLQAQQGDSGQDSSGNVPVFVFSIDPNSAESQMRLNGKVLGNLGPGPQELPGLGDQAFDMAGAMIMMRKGDKLVRIMYSMCPCSVEAVKPLAKEIADAL